MKKLKLQTSLVLCLNSLGALVFSAPAIAESIRLIKEDVYIHSHPSGGPNTILRRQDIGTPAKPTPKSEPEYIRSSSGGRAGRAAWEQQLNNVQEVKGYEVIYIPEQKLINGGVFPGNYWCLVPEHHLFRKFRFGSCTKDGFKFRN